MDNRQFFQKLAERTGRQPRDLQAAAEALGSAIAGHCSALDSVAIPGFGTFSAEKRDEYVELSPLTMKRTLYPPKISAEFRPSVILRKRMMGR